MSLIDFVLTTSPMVSTPLLLGVIYLDLIELFPKFFVSSSSISSTESASLIFLFLIKSLASYPCSFSVSTNSILSTLLISSPAFFFFQNHRAKARKQKKKMIERIIPAMAPPLDLVFSSVIMTLLSELFLFYSSSQVFGMYCVYPTIPYYEMGPPNSSIPNSR